MINLSIQNFISFLVLNPVLLRTKKKNQRKPSMVGIEIKDSADPSGYKRLVPPSLAFTKGFGLLGFWVTKSSFKQLLIGKVRECRNEVKAIKKQSPVIKQNSSSSSTDKHSDLIHASKLFSRNKGPSLVKDVDLWCWAEIPDWMELEVDDEDFLYHPLPLPPTHQKKAYVPCSPCPKCRL